MPGRGEPLRPAPRRGVLLWPSEGRGSARRAVSSSRGSEDENMRVAGDDDKGPALDADRPLDGEVITNLLTRQREFLVCMCQEADDKL